VDRVIRVVRIGNFIVNAAAFLLIFLMIAFGGYSLWDTYRINHNAFLDEEILQWKPTGENEENPSLEELIQINPDVRGWITVDDTHIDYPIVQGRTDLEYVNKDVKGEFSLPGSIFMSSKNSADFSDPYDLIYGHHMDNGGMFGDVVKFLNTEYFAEHTTGSLYLPDETDEITFFSCIETDAYDRNIYYPEIYQDDLSGLMEYVRSSAAQYRDISLEPDDRIVALSTCMDAVTNGRAILFGRLRKVEIPDEKSE
jgi:sortase B